MLLVFVLSVRSFGQELVRKEIPRTKEKEIKVSIELSFGSVVVSKGRSDMILIAEYSKGEKEHQELKIEYEVDRDRGELSIRSKDHSRFWGSSSESDRKGDQTWILQFSDEIPISLDIELGAGRGEFDLTDLRVKSLNISSGASSVDILCNAPNKVTAERVVIGSGVSKLTASNLSNLNFRKLSFSGGVGSYRLDFGGSLQRSGDVQLEVGLGAITVSIPEEIPAQIRYEDNWLSSVDFDPTFSRTRKGVIESQTYASSQQRLTIQIESGLGSVKVRSR